MLLCRLDQRAVELLKDQKKCQKEQTVSWAQPVGREPAVGSGRRSWSTELEGASEALWI